jgi:hypothetical protein
MVDEHKNDDVQATCDALMAPQRLSRTLFGSSFEPMYVDSHPVARRTEDAWSDYQGGRGAFNSQVCRPTLAKADITRLTRDHGMHALRHLHASVLLDAGESIEAWLNTSATTIPASRSTSSRT